MKFSHHGNFPWKVGHVEALLRVRIKKGQYFILNICLSSDRKEELTKQPCNQTPTMDTIEFVVKDRQEYLL